jgi:serine/threonine protein kinase
MIFSMGASMDRTSPLFCDYCGAANEKQATLCCFCSRPLLVNTAPIPVSGAGNLAPNTQLNARYRVLAAIGQGGMGTVYRAQDTQLNNRLVAIKELVLTGQDAQKDKEALAAFKHEASLLSGLQHPRLPGIIEQFEEHERCYLVMSFLQGETLEKYMERISHKKLPLSEVMQIGLQMCEILHFLHSQQPAIIFRDVKPDNIMRAPDGKIYLIDFGVARQFKPGQKKDTQSFGSPGYAPPEQFGRSQTTIRSDIYSLGVTLYQLISGYEPGSGSKHERFPSLRSLEPTVPLALVRLITVMLDPDEKKRPANIPMVQQKLEEIAATQTSFASFASISLARKKRRVPSSVQKLISIIIFSIILGGLVGNALGTANANYTYQARAIPIATVGVNPASPAVASATATRTTSSTDPYAPPGALALDDPLSQPGVLQPLAEPQYGGSCQFTGGAFQIEETFVNYSFNCNGNALYQNFTLEVKMTIAQGDCGSIILRASSDMQDFYSFNICSDTTYSFSSNTAGSNELVIPPTVLSKKKTTKAILTGDQTNTIAVVADGDLFSLYANHQKIESIKDSLFSLGVTGLAAVKIQRDTTVVFQDLRIWAIS